MDNRHLRLLSVFVLAFVALRAVGELALVYGQSKTVGLLSAVGLAGQHALAVALILVLATYYFGRRAVRFASVAATSVVVFIMMAVLANDRYWNQRGSQIEVAIDVGYVLFLTASAYAIGNLLTRPSSQPVQMVESGQPSGEQS